MNRILALTSFFVISVAALNAQDRTSTIKGVVLDQQSQYPLIGVTVILDNSDPIVGTVTDINGHFRLENIPVGRHTINITYVGYEPITKSNIDVLTGKELTVDVLMVENIEQLEAVTVIANNKKDAINQLASVSTRTFSVEEASRYSGTFNDPARMAQNYAGVSGASDDRNDIIIRGNSPTGVLWRLEGIDVPSPNHFATLGTTGGPISMLNINNLSNSDFSSGAWSADYGNALSGVFDLGLRNGNSDKREYVGQVGFNGFEFGAEGPFKKGSTASYVANYRYSTLGVFKALGINLGTGSAVPEYQDLTFKMNIPTKNSGKFTLWGVGGVSGIKLEKTKKIDSTNLYTQENNSDFKSKTGMIGASHTYFFNSNTYYKLTLASTFVQTTSATDSLSTTNGSPIALYRSIRKQYRYMAHLKFNKKVSPKSTYNIGFMADMFDINMRDTLRFNNGTYGEIIGFKGNAPLIQAYTNWHYRYGKKTTLTSGVHLQYFDLSKSYSFEPRLGLKYKINDSNTISVGAGLHSQMQPIVVYFSRDEQTEGKPNQNLDFTKAVHGVVAYDMSFKNDIRLKTEVYYQHLYNIPVDTIPSSFSMINQGADFSITDRAGLTNEGTGSNYGLELTLEKFFSKGYYFLATASLFDSKYKGSNNKEYNTVFNGSYVFNALGGYELKLGKNKVLSFNTKLTHAGGKRYTPVDVTQSQLQNRTIYDNENSFSKTYDNYFKIDFKVSFRLIGKKVTQEWFVDLTNITNNKNIFQRKYNVDTNDYKTTFQRGLFPNIQYRILF